jgi:ornithine--oxo-acid transaminase
MAPSAISNEQVTNGSALKPTAKSLHPESKAESSKYHASSSHEAIQLEATYSAHNYHPLPIVFSRYGWSRRNILAEWIGLHC